MESANFIELAIAYYKDKVQQELLEKFRVESCLLLQADAEARRIMVRENIKAMACLKIELAKFKLTYNKISVEYGTMMVIDDYIREIETKIRQYSYKKNHMK